MPCNRRRKRPHQTLSGIINKKSTPLGVLFCYKIKDTANRINGLERPKPNEGYALKNGVCNDIVSEVNINFKVFISIKKDSMPNGNVISMIGSKADMLSFDKSETEVSKQGTSEKGVAQNSRSNL